MTVTILLHKFRIGNEDDPEVYAAEALYQWEKSSAGQWAMKNSVSTPTWVIRQHSPTFESIMHIRGEFSESDATMYHLMYTNEQ